MYTNVLSRFGAYGAEANVVGFARLGAFSTYKCIENSTFRRLRRRSRCITRGATG